MALLAQSAAIPPLRLFASPALHPWESQESSIKDPRELFVPIRHRASSPCQDFSCATRCRFLPTSRNRLAASFCVRRNSRTPLVKRNNVQEAARAPCVPHLHISRRPLHALCMCLLLPGLLCR